MSISRWLLAALLLPVASGAAQAQDATAGGALFRQRCQACHSVKAGQAASGLGPNLAGVVGRKAAASGFAYSTALKNSGLVWDQPTLDGFLTAPMKKVPGTRMVISIPDPRQRADLRAFLAQQKP